MTENRDMTIRNKKDTSKFEELREKAKVILSEDAYELKDRNIKYVEEKQHRGYSGCQAPSLDYYDSVMC